MARRKPSFVLGIVLLAVSASAAGADWRDMASDRDIARLRQLDQARAKALDELRGGQGRGDAGAVAAMLSAPGRAVGRKSFAGDWRCRQIKLGGMAPYIVFGWFHCRIARAGGAFTFQKLDGSQRSSGVLEPENGAFVYLGASNVKGEATRAYSGRRQSLGAETAPDDQIGLLTAIGPNHLRLEMPLPAQESDFDVIELKR
jgi:hypothetical protein